jgi:hypothetical protein
MKKYLNEAPSSVNKSLYHNTDFRDGVVGKSTPSKDKINPSLLADVEKAAKAANVKVSVTTAVTGHKNSGRHPKGNAVDIAMVNGKGFGSKSEAISNGIYDHINRFVDELVKMGYKKNSESGNDKAVLTFGFPAHDNHVHVSRNSDSGTSSSDETKDDDTKDNQDNTKDKIDNNLKTMTSDIKPKSDFKTPLFGDTSAEAEDSSNYGLVNKFIDMITHKENVEIKNNTLSEEIKRIKQLLK